MTLFIIGCGVCFGLAGLFLFAAGYTMGRYHECQESLHTLRKIRIALEKLGGNNA